ncbi:single-stranded DNA-binding protein [Streptomyces sp. B1866]|uniref:single-stranded DNA-binding protein n=1 Tax=Streptomyces sp. B1866 TaxID=3075431 RepID=UPI00288F8411|nr:single-stranded DNA-binding protein [Streptomyces sp. B1866]MDT3400235.1 single-stranded DNA-binding protein [Streptomyces sp. B1866]
MNETWVTVVGNVATAPDFRETTTGVPVVRFRLATAARRWDREREAWTDGPTSFYTVWARRALAANVAASVALGEPLLVHGTLKVREQQRHSGEKGEREAPGDGGRWATADIEAVAVGHDMARGTSAFRRVAQARPLPAVPVGAPAL